MTVWTPSLIQLFLLSLNNNFSCRLQKDLFNCSCWSKVKSAWKSFISGQGKEKRNSEFLLLIYRFVHLSTTPWCMYISIRGWLRNSAIFYSWWSFSVHYTGSWHLFSRIRQRKKKGFINSFMIRLYSLLFQIFSSGSLLIVYRFVYHWISITFGTYTSQPAPGFITVPRFTTQAHAVFITQVLVIWTSESSKY